MNAIILTQDELKELVDLIKGVHSEVAKLNKDPKEIFIDNVDLMKMLHISKRTAQTWRDEGKISFSQISGKIFYSLEDVTIMMKKYYHKSFAD